MKIFILLISFAIYLEVNAQHELVNNAAQMYVGNGTALKVNGTLTNQPGGTLSNNGTLTISGNIINNQAMSSPAGKLVFNNSNAQTLSGTADFLTMDVEVNNPAGVTLQTLLKVDGLCNFMNGVITAPDVDAPLLFTANGLVAGVSDASHVNGYVVREGTGNFSYPVGDGSRHQGVSVDATVNADGIRVNYVPGNAGSGSFTGATPLRYYNTLEYWNITPLTTATGSVTINWDDYNNIGIGNISDLRVAHYTGGAWVNEAAVHRTGNTGSGKVTSQPISTWSPFSLGSVSLSSTLPVNWITFNATFNAQQQTVISWQVHEYQVKDYQLEKSTNALQFTSFGTLQSKGTGNQHYQYTDQGAINHIAYYRIKQTDLDGKFSYSPVIKLQALAGNRLTVYPLPFKEGFTVISPITQTARLTTTDGKLLQLLQLKQGSNYVNSGLLSKGIYLLITAHAAQKIMKN